MKAMLRTYESETSYNDEIVDISDEHKFEDDPYVDTVPFSVGSNQTIIEINL